METRSILIFTKIEQDMKAAEIINILETFAPLSYQESYDNCGLQVGDAQTEVTGVLLTLDITEAVVDEAISRNCNLIIAHHPVIFSGLKRLNGRNYVERIVLKAIKNDLLLYAAHTNMDNARAGVNAIIAERLELADTKILQPMQASLKKLYTYAPESHAAAVREALFAAGAGQIGHYSECSFSTPGNGTFRADETANPYLGEAGGERTTEKEIKIEVLVQRHQEAAVLKALMQHHPYEEVAYELIALQNQNQEQGAGMVGNLPEDMDPTKFLSYLKDRMQASCIRHTKLLAKKIRRVAVCGGSGSFLLKDAINAGADIFITSDYKYHQFFDAENRIVIADIGHYESEQFTVQLFERLLKKKIPNFAPLLSGVNTNPVNYFV